MYLFFSFDSEFGRHVKALEFIPKGSVVFKETPFASILLPDYFSTNCHHCYAAIMNPI